MATTTTTTTLLSTNLLQENGKYLIKIPFKMTIDYVSYDGSTSSTYLSVFNGINYLPNVPYGTKFGELFLDVWVQSFDPLDHDWTNFRSSKTRVLIPLFANFNTTLYKNTLGKIYKIEVRDTMEISIDYYPNFNYFQNKNYFMFDYTNMWLNTMLFSKKDWYFFYPTVNTEIYNTTIEYSSLDFRTGDILKGQTLLPKLSIKDFILNVAKYFNLGLMNNDGKLKIHKKTYSISPNAPLLEVQDMNVSNIDFSVLKMSSEMTTNNLFKDYKTTTNKNYGEQIINTGYNIKTSAKEVKFDVCIPPLIKDTNYYAYSTFCGYNNNGNSRSSFGVTEGNDAKVQFGYINIQNEPISIANDTYYEANMTDNGYYMPTEVKWLMVNEHITYSQSGDTYYYPIEDYAGQSRLISKFNTFSPYKFDNSGNVTTSLEMSKPDYNFNYMTDSQYSSGITHYRNYFHKLISDIYSVNAHILNVNMWIDSKIDIYSIINYKNSQYVIQEITEYDPTRVGFYNVKLLRVNDITNYELPLPPNLYHLNLDLTYDILLYGNSLAYADHFLGNNSEVLVAYDSPTNWQLLYSLIPYGIDDSYYSFPYTHLKQAINLSKVIISDKVYFKLANNYILYFENGPSGIKYHGRVYEDSSVIEATTGSTTTGAWEYIIDPPEKLPMSGDTRKITRFYIYEPILKSISTYGSDETKWKISVQVFFQTEGGTEPFDFYQAKARFGNINVVNKQTFDNYVFTYDTSDESNFIENINYITYSGPYRAYEFDLVIQNNYEATPTFDDVEVKLLGSDNEGNWSGFDWQFSIDGTFNSATTIDCYTDTSVSPHYPSDLIFGEYTTPQQYSYTLFSSNNGDLPITADLSIIHIDYSYSIT